MRPVRTIIAVIFAAAVAVTGCSTHTTADQPSAAPAPSVTAAPAPPATAVSARQPAPTRPTPAPQPPIVRTAPPRYPAPVLADGRYDSYIRRVQVPIDYGTSQLVVDLVQVFKYPASVDAAITDGLPRDQAQVLDVWVRNQNPRLRTLPLASDLQIDLLPGDCIESRNHQLAKLVKDSRAMSNSRPAYYFTLTVAGGAVHHIQEDKTFSAC
jgi:hypothetical protein